MYLAYPIIANCGGKLKEVIFLPSEHKKVINCLEMTKSSESLCTIIVRERHALLGQNLGRRS